MNDTVMLSLLGIVSMLCAAFVLVRLVCMGVDKSMRASARRGIFLVRVCALVIIGIGSLAQAFFIPESGAILTIGVALLLATLRIDVDDRRGPFRRHRS